MLRILTIISLLILTTKTFSYPFQVKSRVGDFRTQKLDLDGVRLWLHYPDEKKEYARKVMNIMKNDFPKIHNYFNYKPQSEVHLNIYQEVFTANGAASIFPRNQIYLFDFPPLGHGSLMSSKDWIRTLVVHEYIHVLTLEMTSGVVDFFRGIFGSLFKWNQLIPLWMIEGVAVWGESVFTDEGRLKNERIQAQVYEFLKSGVCDGAYCLDYPDTYPFSSSAYWVGGAFLEHLESKKEGSLSCVFKKNSRRIPFFINGVFDYCTGSGLQDLWDEFRKDFITNHESLSDYCPISQNSCDEVGKVYSNRRLIDHEVGMVENSRYIVVPVNEAEYSESRKRFTDKLLVINKKTLESSWKEFDFPIEFTYFPNEESSIIHLSKLVFNKGEMKRRIVHWNIEKDIETTTSLSNTIYELTETKAMFNNKFWVVGEEELPVGSNIQISQESKKIKITNQKPLEETLDKRSYKPLRHLSPNYWGLTYSSLENIDTWSIFSSVNDPLDVHTISAQLNYFSGKNLEENSLGHSLIYQYGPKATKFFLGSSDTYFYDSFYGHVDSYKTLSAGLNQFFFFGRTTLSLNARFIGGRVDDFFGKSDTKTYSTGINLTHRRLHRKNFINYWSLLLDISKTESDKNEDYMKYSAGVHLKSWVADLTQMHLSGIYTHYDKSSFAGGYARGGGYNLFLGDNTGYSNYTIGTGNIIGNTLQSYRVEFESKLAKLRSGSYTWPLYGQNLALFYGLEYTQGDVIIDRDDLLIDDNFVSDAFLGLRMNLYIFYRFPVVLDFVYAQSFNNKDLSAASLLVRVGRF